jgi:hypothetical protein
MRLKEILESLHVSLKEYRPTSGSHVILVTGKLARAGLTRMMEAIDPEDFTYEIRVLDLQVAAWLTSDLIIEEIGDVSGADVILIPGKTQGETEDIQKALGVQVLRGPGCYSELPVFLEEIGFEDQVADVPRPRLLILGSDASSVSDFVAKTFEVPLITPDLLAQQAEQDKVDVPDLYRHNVMAELLRARLIQSDAQKGYVIAGYPRNERDVRWLQDLGVRQDGIMFVGEVDPELLDAYQSRAGIIRIAVSKNVRDMQAEAIESVEAMMQQCVVPDMGAAPLEKD